MAAYDSREGEDAEPPLDPAAERVRRKLAGLLFGSLAVMVLGLAAVFSAILYKVSYAPANPSSTPAPAALAADSPVAARLPIPAGTELLSTSLDDGRALLHIRRADGSHGLLLVDLATGATLGRYDLAAE